MARGRERLTNFARYGRHVFGGHIERSFGLHHQLTYFDDANSASLVAGFVVPRPIQSTRIGVAM